MLQVTWLQRKNSVPRHYFENYFTERDLQEM